MTLDDPRHRTKLWLDEHLNNSALTMDNDTTQVKYITAYGFPEYPLVKVFRYPKNVDLAYSLNEPVSTGLYSQSKSLYGYVEKVPITISCINKTGLTATKLKWKAEQELRRICETYPFGSLRLMDTRRDTVQRLGATVLYQTEFTLTYKRVSDTTPSYPKITWGPSASPSGIYIFPNVVEFTPWGANKDAWNDIPAMSGDSVEPLGSKAFEFRLVCDLDIEPDALTWKRPQTTTPKTDATNYDLLYDLCHNEGISQSYHTFTLQSGGPALSVRLCDDWFVDNENMLHLHFREYRTTSADALTYKQRLGIT